MHDLLAEDLVADELLAGRTKRKTKYRIKRRRKMRNRTKTLRRRQTNLSQRRRQRKLYKKRMRTDRNFRKNRKDYRKQYYKKNKKGSVGYALPFELEFLYEGKPAYLMSLSEMFDAVNIYVEGETAILVDLNDFLSRTEWYLEEDLDLFLDMIGESYAVLDEDPQDAWSEFTLDERDPPAKKKVDKSASICDRTDNLALMQMLLAILRGAHFAHWTSHWQVKGGDSYSDHQLMGRIYNVLIEEIDILAEKIVGTFGGNAVNVVEQAQLMANQLLPLAEAHSMNDPIRRALLIEEGLQVVFKNVYETLKRQGGLTLGLDDFIMSMANAHETSLYLLRQRCDVRPSVRMAFNKYNAPELMGQLLAVLNKNGLEDTVRELKTMKVPQIVNQAWLDRE